MSIEKHENANEFRYRNEIDGCKQRIKDSTVTQKEDIQKWALCLEKLNEIDKRTEPVNTICSQIVRECRDEIGWTRNQVYYIYECLDDKYKRKYELGEGVKKPNVSDLTLENLNPRVLDPFYYDENLDLLSKDQREILHDKLSNTMWKLEKFCDERGELLLNHEPKESKIATKKPEPSKSEIYYGLGEVLIEAQKLVEQVEKLKQRAYEYPPTDDEDDEDVRDRLLIFAEVIKYYGLFSSILADKRWAKALNEMWFKSKLDGEEYDAHERYLKDKVEILNEKGFPTGKYRKMPRKSIKKNLKNETEIRQDIENVIQLWGSWMNGMTTWRDVKSQMAGFIAKRRADMHPKLSDSA